ncbi:hypothetical protein B0H12DRAFT_1221398, partial [Mycena haematopus]
MSLGISRNSLAEYLTQGLLRGRPVAFGMRLGARNIQQESRRLQFLIHDTNRSISSPACCTQASVLLNEERAKSLVKHQKRKSFILSTKARVSAALNGPVRVHVDLCTDIETLQLPQDQVTLLLPLFFIHLDPTLIPAPNLLDVASEAAMVDVRIERAVESLNALTTLVGNGTVPVEAYQDLWSRVWPWMHFIDTYWYALRVVRPSDQMVACQRNTWLLMNLAEHPDTAAVIVTTHGVRTIMAKAWGSMLRSDALASHPEALLGFCKMLAFLCVDVQNSAYFAEILDALGGERQLISTLKEHITHACTAPPSEEATNSLSAAIQFVASAGVPYDFSQALMASGIAVCLVSALGCLSASPLSASALLTGQQCFHLLEAYLPTFPEQGYVWVSRAVRAGLLRYIIHFAMCPLAADIIPFLRRLLSTTLLQGLASLQI